MFETDIRLPITLTELNDFPPRIEEHTVHGFAPKTFLQTVCFDSFSSDKCRRLCYRSARDPNCRYSDWLQPGNGRLYIASRMHYSPSTCIPISTIFGLGREKNWVTMRPRKTKIIRISIYSCQFGPESTSRSSSDYNRSFCGGLYSRCEIFQLLLVSLEVRDALIWNFSEDEREAVLLLLWHWLGILLPPPRSSAVMESFLRSRNGNLGDRTPITQCQQWT